MSSQSVGFSLLILSVGLLIGKMIRVKVRWVQRLFLPSSIVGGVILLVRGPQVLGRIPGPWGETGLLTQAMVTTWSALPGLLISVVFATMFLGQDLPSPKRAAKLVGPQLALGTAFASSQYVVGLLLAALIIVPFFGSSPMTGGLIEIGFEGGHGTAAGMRDVMTKLGFNEGADLAVGIATVGLVSGIIVGIAIINWGVRNGKTEILKNDVQLSIDEQRGLFRKDEYYSAGKMTSRPASVEPLSLHIAIMALAILIGWLILEGLRWIEHATYASIMIGENTPLEIFSYVPLFPMALIGGVILQLIAKALGVSHVIDPQMMLRIQGWALDFLVISAIATVSIKAVGENLGAFLVLSVGGIVINLVLPVADATRHRPFLVRTRHRRPRPVHGRHRHRRDPHAHHRPRRLLPRFRGLRLQAAHLRTLLRRWPRHRDGHSDHLPHWRVAAVFRDAGGLRRCGPGRAVPLRPQGATRP